VLAVESLGALMAAHPVVVLMEALSRGVWWAPFRTAELRRAGAPALQQIGTQGSLRVLEEASASGPRGVRAAIRAVRS
jgi:hypothetical protein